MSVCELDARKADPDAGRRLDDRAAELADEIRRMAAQGDGEAVSDQALQDIMMALITLYRVKTDARGEVIPLSNGEDADRELSATSVLMAVTGLLKGADLALFELGMFQSWSGMK